MEQENITQEVLQKNRLNQVTTLSKYLAMILFILMPFIGGWIGYHYAPEKVVEKERIVVKEVEVERITVEGSVEIQDGKLNSERPFISMRESESGSLVCRHSQLNLISEDSYRDWPVYRDDEFGISFSYPAQQPPNVEKRFTGYDGNDYLRVGYNPNLNPELSGHGKPHLYDIDDTWEVEMYKEVDRELLVGSDYCSEHNWCLFEEVDYNDNFETYVSSFEHIGMLDPEERNYFIYSKNGLVIDLYEPAATGFDGSPCTLISNIFNIDKIAHSLRLN